MDWSIAGQIGQAAGSLAQTGYNIFAGERGRKDALKEQQWQHNFAENAAQIRALDLQKAGLHPTLAAGNAGSNPAPVTPPAPESKNQSNVMQNALYGAQLKTLGAQANLTNAEADRVRQQTGIDLEDLAIRKTDVGYRGDANTRAIDLHQFNKIIYSNDAKASRFRELASRAGLEGQKLTNFVTDIKGQMDQYELAYVKEHGHRIPPQNYLQQVEEMLKRLLSGAPGSLTRMLADSFTDIAQTMGHHIGTQLQSPVTNAVTRVRAGFDVLKYGRQKDGSPTHITPSGTPVSGGGRKY